MQADTVFAGPVPETYDRYLGPMLFQPMADATAERLRPTDATILETAAGTGVVTRALAAAAPRSAIVATDLNQAMLDVAAQRQPQPSRVEWRQADAQALPFEAASFDLVLCCFGVMFMPSKLAAYAEARRVLRPGGRFIFTVWDSIESNPLMHVVEETLAGLFPAEPPRFLSRTPCGYRNAAQIERHLREAGFASVEIEELQRPSGAATAHEAATGLCQGSPLRGEIEARAADGLARATQMSTDALRRRFGDGAFQAPMQALLATAA